MIPKACQSGLHCTVCRTDQRQRRACGFPGVCPRGLDVEAARGVSERARKGRGTPRQATGAAEQIRHIGEICAACRERLAHPSIPEDEAAIIEDCAFAAMSACRRRRAIREGWARCPLKLWQNGRL